MVIIGCWLFCASKLQSTSCFKMYCITIEGAFQAEDLEYGVPIVPFSRFQLAYMTSLTKVSVNLSIGTNSEESVSEVESEKVYT